jgi:hypothetical protein
MNRNNWLYVGYRLLGLYFGISGLATLIYVATLIIQAAVIRADSSSQAWDARFPYMWMDIVEPAFRLLFGYVLLRHTRGCVRFILPEAGGTSAQPE